MSQAPCGDASIYTLPEDAAPQRKHPDEPPAKKPKTGSERHIYDSDAQVKASVPVCADSNGQHKTDIPADQDPSRANFMGANADVNTVHVSAAASGANFAGKRMKVSTDSKKVVELKDNTVRTGAHIVGELAGDSGAENAANQVDI